MNIDAQDAQDNQDGRLLQETLTRAMIACGFEVGLLLHFDKRRLECKRLTRSNTDARDYKPAVSRKILCILCIHVNQKSTRA